MINLRTRSFNLFGFTLMELVMVILILSILAIVAAPRFLSVQDEAMKQARKEMIMNINAALNMGAVKAALEGKVNGALTIDGQQLCIKNGFPTISETVPSCYNLFYLLSPLPENIVVTEIYCDGKKETKDLKGENIYKDKNTKFLNCEYFKLRLGDDSCIINIEQRAVHSKPVVTEVCAS